MSTKVVMEALSPTMEEGRLVEWKKQEGDAVAVGDVIAEVETDKAVMELVARAGGTLLKQVVPAGATVPVSELVALIGEPGEKADGQKGDRTNGQPSPPPPAEPAKPKAEKAEAPRSAAAAPAPARSDGGGRVKASPLARRMAADRGIDLGAVAGSGPEGRVVARDLESTTAPAGAPAPAAPPAPQPLPPSLGSPRVSPSPTFLFPRSGRPSPSAWSNRSGRSRPSISPPR